MLLTVRNITNSAVSVGGRIGTLPRQRIAEFELTVADIEELRATLVNLTAAGKISYVVSANHDDRDDDLEMATIGMGGGGGGGGVSAHSALTGLNADDHPQYFRADGTRALTGNHSVPEALFTAGSNNLLASHAIGSCDTSGGTVDIALPAVFTGARAFVIHKRSTDSNVIRLTGATVNGFPSPFTLPGSDGAFGTWFLYRTAASAWYVSPGSEEVGGGLPSIPYLQGWSASRYYAMASNPLSGQANFGLAARIYCETYEQTTRMIIGNDGGFGDGASIIINGEAITGRITDSGSTLRQIALFAPPMVNKWINVFFRCITQGSDLRAQLYINGSMFVETIQNGVTATMSGGGNLTVGCRAGADQGATQERIAGVGYALRNVTPAQIAAWSRACTESGQMEDLPEGFTNVWRVEDSEPGATWTPFAGAGNLTRTGTALTHGVDTNVIYR